MLAMGEEVGYRYAPARLKTGKDKIVQGKTFLEPVYQNQMLHVKYRVFIKYCVFSFTLCDFSELCQFCCSAGFLPAWCVYTH